MALKEEIERQGTFLFRYRSFLPIIILVVGIMVYVESKLNLTEFISDFVEVRFAGVYKIICLCISFLGLLIRVLTVGFSPKNTSGRNTKTQVADELNTTGMYSTVRHPLYVGNFLMWLGIAMITTSFWFVIAFIFMYWVYYERIMFAEEQFLRNKFGQQYLDWSEKTPSFIPRFRNWHATKLSFSWKKILKKEKNGFCAVFVVFFVFESLRKFLEEKSLLEESWLTYATLISGCIYLILKFLKKKTTVLDESGR